MLIQPWTTFLALIRLQQPCVPSVPDNDFNRGIMRFDGADNPILVMLSGALILGGISALVIWGLTNAYPTT